MRQKPSVTPQDCPHSQTTDKKLIYRIESKGSKGEIKIFKGYRLTFTGVLLNQKRIKWGKASKSRARSADEIIGGEAKISLVILPGHTWNKTTV